MKKVLTFGLAAITGAVFGAGVVKKFYDSRIKNLQSASDKYHTLFYTMYEWMKIKQDGKNLAIYFEKNGYRNIAIYGMGDVGEILLSELKHSEIKVAYGIDRRAGAVCTDIKVVSAEDALEPVDAVIVTAITYFSEIEEKLSQKLHCPILSLEEVLYEV